MGLAPRFGRACWGIVILALAYLAVGPGAEWLPLASPYKRHLAAGMLRLVLLTLGAGWLLAWWVGRAEGSALAVHQRTACLAAAAGMLAYAAGLSLPTEEVAALVGTVLLLGSRHSLEQFPTFHRGALSLLARGKLAGVGGLMWVLMARVRRERLQP